MRTLKLYRNDFSKPHNDRDTESSMKVVESWFDPMTKYAPEDIPDDRCLRLVAERLVIRRLLGIGSIDAHFESSVASVEVFGRGSPTFSDLSAENVFVATAFVPLTPLDEHGCPYLARLYCVGGLQNRYADLQLEGADDPALEGYAWFLEGVPRDQIQRGIVGRSWLLAARLLTEVVRKRDVQTARNLATHYIVTGNMVGDAIRSVEIKRKPELARQFENFKWIIPKENDMDIPMRKLEKPATLEEAYKLIETMQSKATRSLFRFLKEGNLDGMKEQYEIGADLFAIDGESRRGVMQLAAVGMCKAKKETKGLSWGPDVIADCEHPTEFAAAKRAEKFQDVVGWLRSEGADPVMMYYVLAKFGLDDALWQVLREWPVEARDENGCNVVELALKNRDYALVKKFYSLGCRCRADFDDAFLVRAIKAYVAYLDGSDSVREKARNAYKDGRMMVEAALSAGLSPARAVSVEGGLKTSLFGAALYGCDVDMIRLCLDSGADPNLGVDIWRPVYEDEGPAEIRGWDWFYDKDSSGSPLYVVNCANGAVSDEERKSASNVLIEFGAHQDERIAKRQFTLAVKNLGSRDDSRENRDRLLDLLVRGLSFDEPKDVKYVSCEVNPRSESLRTTLWGWAVYNADIEMMRKCLEMGASVNGSLRFSHVGSADTRLYVADLQYLNGRTPVEVILMSEDIPLELQDSAFELLKEFGLKESDCPKDLLDQRHPDEVAKLNTVEDIHYHHTIEMGGSVEYPRLGCTDVLGMSVWYLWVDVLERCLSLGGSARNVIHYGDWHAPEGYECDVASGSPKEIIDKEHENSPQWLRNRAYKLLAKYSNK